VTSSVAVSEAETWVKSMYMTESWFKTRKKIIHGNQKNCYINLQLLDGFGMEFTVC